MSNFDLIAGYEKEKEELKKICDVLNNREYYLQKGAKMPKGIIFYGDAGNGKTLFTHVLSKECNLPMYVIDLGNAKDENSVMKQIKKAFDKANKSRKYSIIFVDELDKILPDANQSYVTDRSKIILTQLLTLIDGIDKDSNVFFVATCNNFGSIPETMLRPGRIDKKIMLPNPDYSTRKAVLSMYMIKSKCAFDTDVKDIAARTSGFSCSGLETLINECILESDENNHVSESIVFKKISEISLQDIQREKNEEEKRITSCHNLGYFIVANTFCNNANYMLDLQKGNICNDFFSNVITDVSDDWGDDCEDDDCDDDCDDEDLDDYDEDEDVVIKDYYCLDDFKNAISVLFGGIAAEKAIFGRTYDDTYSDLSAINDLLFRMSETGMLGFDYLYDEYRCRRLPYSPKFIEKLNEIFEQIVKECYAKAEKIIVENVDLLRYLQRYLIQEQNIKRDRTEELISDFKRNRSSGEENI